MLNIAKRFWRWLTAKPDQTSYISADVPTLRAAIQREETERANPVSPQGGSATVPPQNKPILSTEFGRATHRVHNPPSPPAGPSLTDAVVAYAVYDAVTSSPPPPPPPPSYDPGPSSYDSGSSYSSGAGDFSGGSGAAGDF